MQLREIERSPEVPPLSSEVIDLLTELCFRYNDVLEPADLLFIFSTPTSVSAVANQTRSILDKGLVNKVFVSGGSPKFADYAKEQRAESEMFFDSLNPVEFPQVQFLSEKLSTDTRSNVTEALKVLDFTSYKRIIFIFTAHAAGRGYLTLKKFLPNTEILQAAVTPMYAQIDTTLTAETWTNTEFGRSRVWGEYLRIAKYGQRGDIAYDVVTKELVDTIKRFVS